MLVLERKIGEEIIMDNNIFVMVTQIIGKVVRIEIESGEEFCWNFGTAYAETNYCNVDLKISESIIINKHIKIMSAKITGQQRVRLGFDAPKHIKILRKELTNG